MTAIRPSLLALAVVLALCLASGAGAAVPVAQISSAPETILEPAAPGFSQYGVVFGVSSGGQAFRCSGTSVRAANRSLVVTAGHCVYDEGEWASRNWVFVPGYRYGERPFGTFTAHWIGTTPGWLHHENSNYDVGMAVVSRNERGQTLAQAVGADRFASGLSPAQTFDVYGYPVARPFTGSTLQRCPQAPFEGHGFEAFETPGPLDLALECDVTGGASGGGWVISGNRIDGVTSNGYSDDPLTTYGPYFGKAVRRLYERAAKVR